MSESPPSQALTRPSPPIQDPQDPLMRNVRQLGLFLSGAAFMAASVFVTRRSVVRRQLDAFPRFYIHNRNQPRFDSSDRSLLAVQAFGLATLNVMSFGVLLVGGISWGWDLCSVRELRERSQAALRRQGSKMVDPEEEKAMKEMMDQLLVRMGMELPKEGEGEKKEDGTEAESAEKAATR